MARLRIVLLAIVTALAMMGVATAPASAAPAGGGSKADYYLSLGDSLSVGIQPLGPNGDNVPTADGYPQQLVPYLQHTLPGIQLKQVGCPGATANTVLNGGDAYDCGYKGGTQLSTAVDFIKTHRVDALTINLGSNDVIQTCVNATGIDRDCVLKAIAALPGTLGSVLDQLNAALPKSTARSGMTYYDPYLGYYAVNPELAHLSLDLSNVLNDTLRAIYRSRGFAVAQVAFVYRMNVGRPIGTPPVPTNVSYTCALTWFCTAGNIHPNVKGYAKIAEAFAWSLRSGR